MSSTSATPQPRGPAAPSISIPINNSTNRSISNSKEQHDESYVNGNRQLNGAVHPFHTRRPRILSVDEALQYSPFSSITPFNPGIIPLPSAEVSSSGPLFPTPNEREAARQSLASLDADILRTQGKSAFAQQSLSVLKGYFETSNITDFTFKQPCKLPERPLNGQTPQEHGHQGRELQLSPFATTLLHSPQVNHRLDPTPISPKSPSKPSHGPHAEQRSPSAQSKKHPLTPAKPGPMSVNQAAFVKNAQTPAPQYTNGVMERMKHTPVVMVPPLSAESRSNKYITFQDDKAVNGHASISRIAPTQNQEQKLVADQASKNHRNLVQAIIQADDQFSHDSSISNVNEAAPYFLWIDFDGVQMRTLAPAILVKLESSLQKAIAARRASDVPVDDFCRLQSLCEKSLTALHSLELSVSTSWSGDDFSAWIERATSAEIALRSARVILRLMIHFPLEKSLGSEEMLQNVIDALNKVLTSCIVPIVESRPIEAEANSFELTSAYKKEIGQVLYQATRVMRLLVELLDKVDTVETIVTALEFFAIRILFVENAPTEKESILGIQKFEGLRRTAMDIITEIFSKYSEQRPFIFDEILASWQKLPTKGQNARQYKLSDGTSIQLVTALIIRLIQTSAAAAKDTTQRSKLRGLGEQRHRLSGADMSESEEVESDSKEDVEAPALQTDGSDDETNGSPKQRLAKIADTLSDHASKDAQYVVRYLVRRAMTSSKTGDQPHRHLLDMFTEDLFSVLGNPEWPGAELLLRALLVSMTNITDNKSTAPAKTMALELLGMMGSAISELVASTQSCARSLENQDSPFSGYLRQLFDDYLDGSLQNSELVIWDGPYRIVMEFLASADSEGMPTRSAQLYYLTQWARGVSSIQSSSDPKNKLLAGRLRKMVAGRIWEPADPMDNVSKGQCRLAYALTVLSMMFCRQFDTVFKILLDSITSEQTTVRTRSLKSVTQMLERDPSLLDRARSVKGLLIKCAADGSSMVRDSTLMLIGKCIQQKAALEQDFFRSIVSLASDPAVNVRKRSMRLLKEIFTRTKRHEVKVMVAECLLQSSNDPEKGISETANQLLEETLLSQFWKCSENPSEISIQDRLALRAHLGLIVGITQRGDIVCSILASLLTTLLRGGLKMAESNAKVCRMLVSTAFESMIDPEARPQGLEQKHVVQALTIFARAHSRLFQPDQLQYLQPYITNLSNPEDCGLLRSVVIIFRCVLPVVPTIQQSLLREVQSSLLANVSKLGKGELNEIAACLWTMNGILKNPERLVRLVASLIKHLQTLKSKDMKDQKEKENLRRAKRCIQIAGAFGKHCDFEDQVSEFQKTLPGWKGASASGMIVDSIRPFASSEQPTTVRMDALNSIGLICQSWPHHFNQAGTSTIFQQALTEGQAEIQNIVLSNFRDFFALQEAQVSSKNEASEGNDTGMVQGKLGGSMKASESDGASALIAQRFLHDVLAIALASLDATALTATEVVASINRQGLVHPKESGPALVALETCPNAAIADVAFRAHRDLHQQHESMFEREYMRAILEAYRYQRDIVKDTVGFKTSPYVSKLHPIFEIIKSSKGKYQKKFISNYCSKIDFDVEKLDLAGSVPASLQLARFLTENLAFFDYGRVEELLYTLTRMEKVVADTGSGVSHSINTEVFHVRIDTILGAAGESGATEKPTTSHEPAMADDIAPSRLRQLTTASIILSCLWDTRTFLRRLYGLSSRESKANGKTKDITKAPTKTNGITGDKLVASIAARVESLQSREEMIKQCQEFVELLSIDDEVKVAAEGAERAEDGLGRPNTPSGDEAGTPVPTSGGSRVSMKRKRAGSVAATTPLKKRGRPVLGRGKSSRKSTELDEEWE